MDPYEPEPLPPRSVNWESHLSASIVASMALGEYKGILRGLINPYLLLAPLNYREAVISSRIEGTQATVEEVMRFEIEDERSILTEDQKSAQEVVNYCKAMAEAVKLLESKPLCINTIRELHSILLTSVRGKDKDPGEIRKKQNWIGTKGCTMEQASFLPPDPMYVMDFLSKWENYVHKKEDNILIQLAIIKAQFELIHPFRDGNGRIGRMLVPLILYSKKVLPIPSFYISAYLEKHDDEYRHRLLAISQEKDWDGWISFFLEAMIEQAKENNEKADSIIKLNAEMRQIIPRILNSTYSTQVIDTMFASPMFDSKHFANNSGIPKESVRWIFQKLNKNEIIDIYREGSGSRGTMYIFPRLLEITR
ncbi:Uncharacterised protein [uncultured archaeon]|nr:Uncharacterised protein [uncultured archaeon]